MKYGRYHLVTNDQTNNPVISTIFYVDGDVLNNLYLSEGAITAEVNKELVDAHLEKVESNVMAMNIFYAQLQMILNTASTILTFLLTFQRLGLTGSLISSAFVSTILLLLRKHLGRLILWLLRLILRTYLRAFKKQLIG